MSAGSPASVRDEVWAVVPVKGFRRAKTRLAALLSSARRASVARTLAEHVLETLASSPSVSQTLVATEDDGVAELAEMRGLAVLRDAGGSLPEVVDDAFRHLSRRGASSALLVMGDLPMLGVADIAAMTTALEIAPVVIAPDRRDRGTNALAVRLPAPIATFFAAEGSFLPHRDACVAVGIEPAVVRRAGLAFDVDEPTDYARYRSLTLF